MIVADTSSLITLATADTLSTVLEEYEIHTTETVIEELEDTAEYDDISGEAAGQVLEQIEEITVHETPEQSFQSSRIDEGEGSCTRLTRQLDADFLLTDDLRALAELQTITDAKVAISPIVLKALVKRDVLTRTQALNKLDQIAETRSWLGAPIYRRARELFDIQ
jgi:predicted nucleic acid-binding protein